MMILPKRMRNQVDRPGRDAMQELRLRQGAPPEMILSGGSCWLKDVCTREDIHFVVNAASRYSPWTAKSMQEGYLTAPGGHRIGVCGLTLYRNGVLTGLREITSLCIRVARDFPGIAKNAPLSGSVLILGAPGWGKTTLLRDLIRRRSETETVSVVDEREELFPKGFPRGKRMDLLRGCKKEEGLNMALRTLGPDCIALDEITGVEDANALIRAAGCGVHLLATAHGEDLNGFYSRPVYRMLAEKRIFDWILILNNDKQFTVERMMV